MADEENEQIIYYYNSNIPDVFIGTAVYKVRNIEIHKTGTTTWFNTGNVAIVTIDQTGTITNVGNTTTTGVVSGLSGVFVTNMTSASIVTGPIACTTVVAATSVQAPLGIFASLSAPFKLFDIPHPSAGKEDKRLRHGCLEGPELAVYTRGKTTESIIPIPEYWKDLIDCETITVHLTPTSMDQNLIVQHVHDLEIAVGGNNQLPYHYYVLAERKDVPKLDIEKDA